jgi:hypothetical protein
MENRYSKVKYNAVLMFWRIFYITVYTVFILIVYFALASWEVVSI